MERINKEFGESVPEAHNAVLESQSLQFDIALRAEPKDSLLSVLFDNPFIDTITTETVVTTWTIPLCWSGGMIFTGRFHRRVPQKIKRKLHVFVMSIRITNKIQYTLSFSIPNFFRLVNRTGLGLLGKEILTGMSILVTHHTSVFLLRHLLFH